jgi:hypothetical protein
MSLKELCVIGHPSRMGGADTELDHQIRCWHAMGLTVHICHTASLGRNLQAMKMSDRGCVYHNPRDWPSLQGFHCISFCNGEFLSNLPEIKKYARTTTFVNCMTWNFPKELAMQAEGKIDFHLYQTRHAFEKVSVKLSTIGTYRPLMVNPYFYADEFPYVEGRAADKFRFGRISRGDADKFGSRQLWIYETMTAPVPKEGWIVGWDHRPEKKFGRKPDSDIEVFPEGGKTQQEFYRHCEAVIMTTETFENLPRVGFEAMASGSLLLVDNRGGWSLQVDDGVTGWLCRDDKEFVYKACRTAFEAEEADRMRQAARAKLERLWGLETAMQSWERVFDTWESI